MVWKRHLVYLASRTGSESSKTEISLMILRRTLNRSRVEVSTVKTGDNPGFTLRRCMSP